MTTTVITDIGQLVTSTGDHGDGVNSLGVITDAVVEIRDDRIHRVGRRTDDWVESAVSSADEVVSVAGRAVIPGFVDSHTHLVFAGDRIDEFVHRMSGEPYEVSGIETTVKATRAASTDELLELATKRRTTALAQGTTTIEIKTGYGLSVADEKRLALVASALGDQVTFLGAHLIPREYADNPDGYVDLVCGEMLDAVCDHVSRIDVFVEQGAFTTEQAKRILLAGKNRGRTPVLHASQLGPGDGAALAIDVGAASLDHGTFLSDHDVTLLAGSDTVVTLLPITEQATRQPPPDARRLIDAGVAVALASNMNPGSGHSSSMPLAISLAVSTMHMSPADALWSATAGGALALLAPDRGIIAPGARADLIELDATHYAHLAYQPGMPLIRRVWRSGTLVVDASGASS
jgi:imidazolonepropionase